MVTLTLCSAQAEYVSRVPWVDGSPWEQVTKGRQWCGFGEQEFTGTLNQHSLSPVQGLKGPGQPLWGLVMRGLSCSPGGRWEPRLLRSGLFSWLPSPERKHLPICYHTVRGVKKARTFIRSEGKREREGGGGSAGDREGGLGLSSTVFMS